MPEWIHNRAKHIQAKNSSMPESEAFAIATQQAHATGKSPKSYGTSKGRHEAKEKYDSPGDDTKTADPGGIGKKASIFRAIAPVVAQENDDRMRQIIREELQAHSSQQPSLKPKKKMASIEFPFSLVLLDGFSDELSKIKSAQMAMSNAVPKPTLSSQVTSSAPKNMLSGKPPTYSQVNPASAPGPAQSHQPTLSPPPVMR